MYFGIYMYTACTYFIDTFSEFCPETTSLQSKKGNSSWTCRSMGMFQHNLFLQKTHSYWGKQSGGMNIPTKTGSHLKMSTKTIHQFPFNLLSKSLGVHDVHPGSLTIVRCYCWWKKPCTSWSVLSPNYIHPRWYSCRISEPSTTYVKLRGGIIWP